MATEFIQHIKMNPEEETLWKTYREEQGSENTMSVLLEYYLPLVIRIVKGVAIKLGPMIDHREYIGSGVIGLHDAIRKYSTDRNCSFKHFAKLRIKGAILDEMRKNDSLSRRQREKVKLIQKIDKEFKQENGRTPTSSEIAKIANLSQSDVENYLAINSGLVSLYDSPGIDGLSYNEILANKNILSPSEILDKKLNKEYLIASISKLSKQEQQFLYFRYYEEMNVKEIAAVFQISNGRVSQLFNEIILKLKKMMNNS